MVQNRRHINLALQGGGAHGAFTWGVLDRLLEDDRIAIDGISGTSAGAMNGAVLAQGYVAGGAAGARQALDRFWHRISKVFRFLSPVHRNVFDLWFGSWNLDRSPAYLWTDFVTRVLSPYELNPFNIDPLRQVLNEQIDIPALRACTALSLFVCTTNVRTGKCRTFDCSDVTVDALLASARLPFYFQAVEIDGDPYWDGGYMGNPAIYPLIDCCDTPDIVIVQINPLTREGTPRTAVEIINRLNEITFNAALMREMRSIAFIHELIEQHGLEGRSTGRLRKMHVHMIAAENRMKELGVASKLNPDLEFLEHLKGFGRECADKWLAATIDDIGRRSTVDIHKVFL
ncbi:MAG: patatin-like phospholipase family protein [Alphaproteobacteria bacterium]|nr:patatin-like phospholipase family protein [Alphaproteobacteria bacterium]